MPGAGTAVPMPIDGNPAALEAAAAAIVGAAHRIDAAGVAVGQQARVLAQHWSGPAADLAYRRITAVGSRTTLAVGVGAAVAAVLHEYATVLRAAQDATSLVLGSGPDPGPFTSAPDAGAAPWFAASTPAGLVASANARAAGQILQLLAELSGWADLPAGTGSGSAAGAIPYGPWPAPQPPLAVQTTGPMPPSTSQPMSWWPSWTSPFELGAGLAGAPGVLAERSWAAAANLQGALSALALLRTDQAGRDTYKEAVRAARAVERTAADLETMIDRLPAGRFLTEIDGVARDVPVLRRLPVVSALFTALSVGVDIAGGHSVTQAVVTEGTTTAVSTVAGIVATAVVAGVIGVGLTPVVVGVVVGTVVAYGVGLVMQRYGGTVTKGIGQAAGNVGHAAGNVGHAAGNVGHALGHRWQAVFR